MTLIIPPASAHTPVWKIPTYAFINAEPNPIGVGQKINIIMWIDKTEQLLGTQLDGITTTF